jgi:hypothetical protein
MKSMVAREYGVISAMPTFGVFLDGKKVRRLEFTFRFFF